MRRMFSENQIKDIVKESPSEVVEALKGQDINVEGITSKGIANTGDIGATGKITGGEIIENMSGYSFIPTSKQNISIERIYIGAVKNGNKLTLVIFGKATRSGSVGDNYTSLGDFVIPKAVGDKIRPTQIGGLANAVMSATISFFSAPANNVTLNTCATKGTGVDTNTITVYLYNLSNLVENVEYQFRYEITFLLSDSLVS